MNFINVANTHQKKRKKLRIYVELCYAGFVLTFKFRLQLQFSRHENILRNLFAIQFNLALSCLFLFIYIFQQAMQ